MLKNRVIATVLCLLITTHASAQEVDLRGPAPRPGQTLVTTTQSIGGEGVLVWELSGGSTLERFYARTSAQVIKVSILETEDDQPTRVQTAFVKSREAIKTGNTRAEVAVIDGLTMNPMQGGVLTSSRTADGWEHEIENTNDKIAYNGNVDPRQSYPTTPVAVGTKWEITNQQLAPFFRHANYYMQTYNGTAAYELVEIKQTERGRVAVIAFELEATGASATSHDNGNAIQHDVLLTGKGVIERDLSSYTDTTAFEGRVESKYVQEQTNGLAPVERIDLPIKIEASQAVEPAE